MFWIIDGSTRQVKMDTSDKFKRENYLTGASGQRKIRIHREHVAASSRIWGRHGFDGGKDSWDACRGPSPRKSDGTQRNCEHAARSRCLNSSDVHPELACRAGLDVIKAGWPP